MKKLISSLISNLRKYLVLAVSLIKREPLAKGTIELEINGRVHKTYNNFNYGNECKLYKLYKNMIFNIFDKFEEQFCTWYHLELNLTTFDLGCELVLPILILCRDDRYFMGFQRQITKELEYQFHIKTTIDSKFKSSELENKKRQIENSFVNNESFSLKFAILKGREIKKIELDQDGKQLYQRGNLDVNTKYDAVSNVKTKVFLVKQNTLMYNTIENLTCYITLPIDDNKVDY